MKKLCLNENWQLHEAPLKWGKEYKSQIDRQTDGWYDCSLPADVRMPLIEAGVIKDPVLSDYCRESEWIEDRSWWFRKTFDGSAVCMEDDIVELVLEGLDTRSDIFINGQFIGCHRNVHYPFVYDVKELLVPGENEIMVRVTSGLEEVAEEDLAELDHAVCLESNNGGEFRGDGRRSFVRRPQYTVGWDWGPKVITIGITGNVCLRSYKTIAIREVHLHTEKLGETARVHAMVNIEDLCFISSKSCDVTVQMVREGAVCAEAKLEKQLLTSGYNYLDLELEVKNPCLWWPNGYGEQPLYEVRVCAACGRDVEEYPAFSFGIRTIQLDTSVISGEDRNFILVVNGKTIYCKGGNWVPNDFIYARVPDEKYHVLTDEAAEANFNMIRVWGGGLYERDLFYELCDQKGLLLWHDFMFACSTYPDHRQWFRDEMRQELDYQTKRLRNHCCMGLYCGTNEVHWIFNSIDNPRWGIEFSYEHQYGLRIANLMAKEIIRNNCPQIPYWNSSPYGGELPNDDTVGDVHRWHNALMSKKMEERIEAKDYDTIESKFVSEYGFIGPCCRKSTEEYMDGASMDREGNIWHMHSNVFEKGTVNAAIEKNYLDHPETLSLDDYILYGGMVHGLMYGYSLEAIRFKEHCGGGLFWMYNDAWGEVGWTIIDYYLRRKIPFYAVKRALAHQKFTMRAADGQLVLQGANDYPEDLEVSGKLGYVSFDGKVKELRDIVLKVPAGERTYLLKEKLPERDYTAGTVMLYTDSDAIDNIWLRTDDMRQLNFGPNPVRTVEVRQEGEDKLVTVTADGFVHGVYAEGDYDCSDCYFDLLPGEVKTFRIKGIGGKEPVIKQVK